MENFQTYQDVKFHNLTHGKNPKNSRNRISTLLREHVQKIRRKQMKAHSWKKINNFRKHNFKTLIMDFSKILGKNLKILLIENFQTTRNQNFNISLMKSFQKCQGVTFSNPTHGKFFKNVRTSHAQKVSMEIFQQLQETIFQNITHGFSSNFRKNST